MGKEFDCSRDSSLFCDLEKRNGVLALVGPVEIGGLCLSFDAWAANQGGWLTDAVLT